MKTPKRQTGRRPTAQRPTPFLDVWLAELQQLLAGDRRRELIDYLAGNDPRIRQRWQNWIQKVMVTREMIPNGEDVLRIAAWMRNQAPKRRKNRRTATR